MKLFFGGAVLILIVLSVLRLVNFWTEPEPDKLSEPVSVLIADFENETGNDLYTDVLEDLLRIGIEIAPFVDNYPRRDAHLEVLELATDQSPEPRLNLEGASLLATKKDINVVIGGRIYSGTDGISIVLSGPQLPEQTQLFEIAETADSADDVISSIVRLANRLRLALGDHDRPDYSGSPETFASASLEAAAEYMKGQRFQQDRDLELAIGHYSKAIELDPEFIRAYVGRALCKFELGMTVAAKKDWEFALPRLGKLSERARRRTLIVYYATVTEDWHKALEEAERLVERYPADNAGLNNIAVGAFYTLDFDRAREAGKAALDRYPGASVLKTNLALYSMYAGDFEESSRLANEVIEQYPNNSASWVAIALSSLALGDHSSAQNIYTELMGTSGYGKSVAMEGVADLLIYNRDYMGAVTLLEEAIDVDFDQNSNESAAIKHTMLAESYLALDDWDMALVEVQKALDIGTSNASMVASALILTKLGELGQAELVANELAHDLSVTRRAYANLIRARIAEANNRPIQAIELLKTAIQQADLWHVRFTLGNVYLESGNYVEAFGEFQACRDRIGESLSIYLNDRPTFRMLGKLEAAMDTTDRGLRASLVE